MNGISIVTQHPTSLSGSVEKILFHHQESGFVVFVIALNPKQQITVRAKFPSIQAGQQIRIEGKWVVHPKFGQQFEATACSIEQPTTILGIKKYLGSGLIKGIGPVYAERLVNFFGLQVLDIIDKEPERLQQVPGIGQKRIETIINAWKDQKEISHIMVFLQDKGISTTLATKIYKKYRAKSIELMLENPYRLSEDIWGIGFKTADTIAQHMQIAPNSPKRCRAAILHVISTIVQNGHLYIELKELKLKTVSLLELESTQEAPLKIALHELYESEKIKLIEYQQTHYITLTSYYSTEKGVAALLKMINTKIATTLHDATEVYNILRTKEQKNNISLNEDQQRGILACLQHKITVITGGPGTGKTTLIKQLLSLLDHYKLAYKLAAPTGRAAKRMAQSTGRNALTLHRLLEFDPSIMNFVRNEQNALPVDVLIIDEASMIDIFLAFALLKALPHNARLIFIGDIDQLPSVGAGNFLHDLIASNVVPVIALHHIFRQAQDSLIIMNAHRVNRSEFPTTKIEGKKDFFFIAEDDPIQLPEHLKKIYHKIVKILHINSHETIVLSPMNRGSAGTFKLNHDLQALLNPAAQQAITWGPYTYKMGDRVMQTRNNYEKLVFNGDIGIIEDINKDDQKLSIRFFDRLIEFEFSELDELVLAYAISIHKSQGSEYDAVIIPIFTQHFTLLQKNLLYTAITRAKKLCILIGQAKAIWMAINNNKGLQRTTFLKLFLTTTEDFTK